MSGSAFSTTVAVPAESFEIVAGETVLGGLHGPQSLHQHCDHCKSWVYTRFEPDLGFVNVRATMLDDPAWFEPFVETWTSEALPWALSGAPHSYAAFPEMSDFPRLTAAFAATQAD